MDVMKLKPSQKGLIVRDPISKRPLAEEGEIKSIRGPEGRYWRRRLRDGSVKEAFEKKIYRPIETEIKTGASQKKNKTGGRE